jgi:ribosomal-protein-alanine N-acetyltransferase
VAGRDGGIFRDLPALETERLLLRKMRLDDAEAMFVYASEVTRYVLLETLRSCNTWGSRALSPPAQRSSRVPSLWAVTESRRSS